jgi:hypothetical protein
VCDPSAIHRQRRAGNCSGVLAAQEHHRCRDLLDRSKPPCRLLSKEYLANDRIAAMP